MAETSFQHALIVGATGGIGAALLAEVRHTGRAAQVTAWSRRRPGRLAGDIAWHGMDLLDEASIAAAAAALGTSAPVDLVIVATGLLHAGGEGVAVVNPEKTYRALDAAAMAQAFAINVIGPSLVAKHVLGRLPRDRRAVFAALSARVGSIGDNRLGGWYSYRAAKAGLNQVIKTLSIELARTHPKAVCVGLHPGTVDTALSRPFRSAAKASTLFTPEVSAGHLLAVIDRLTPQESGGVYDWAGARIPA